MFRKQLLGLLSFIVLGVAAPAVNADVVWPPPGFQLGEQEFRMVFVTSTTRDATSSNIADYNAFVTAAANSDPILSRLTGPDGQPVTWTAIASTSSVDAIVNTGTDGTMGDVPIYNLRWQVVADNNADLLGW